MIDRAVTSFARRRWGNRLDPLAIGVAHLGRGGVLWLAADAALQAQAARRPLPSRDVLRSRPCHAEGEALIECPEGPGLPSDQTAAAFAGAYSIARRRPAFAAPLYAIAGGIGLARVYCGVHSLSDVVGGAAFGITIAARASRSRRPSV
jgi:undecaprenyl-diphosphatase